MRLSCSYSFLAVVFCLSRVPWKSAMGIEIHLWNILLWNPRKNLLALQVSFSEGENLSKPRRMGTVAGLRCTGKGRVWSRYLTAGFSCLWKGKRICFNDDKKCHLVMQHVFILLCFPLRWKYSHMCWVFSCPSSPALYYLTKQYLIS